MKNSKRFLQVLSYILVAVVASGATVAMLKFNLSMTGGASKLNELSGLIQERFIGEADATEMEDAAAAAMVASLGDEWSYYISAADYGNYLDQMSNSYVGVGITIQLREDGYLDIVQVSEGAPAEAAGLKAGDILTKVEGRDCAEIGIEETKNLVRGQENTQVVMTVRRGEEYLDFTVERRYFETPVAEGQMVDDNIGYVTIYNFDERCAKETIAAIEKLVADGAKALIFDVRNNPGGYKNELVKVLDYLLPEGPLFRSEYYNGYTELDESDANFLNIPMAVLVNQKSYSAAEFFAAALHEYDAAIVVGEQTYGKGYFQQTYELSDGSAVGLSVGKYYTPDGNNLAGVGLKPDIEVPVDEQMAMKIYGRTLNYDQDPQILAAIEGVKSGIDLDD